MKKLLLSLLLFLGAAAVAQAQGSADLGTFNGGKQASSYSSYHSDEDWTVENSCISANSSLTDGVFPVLNGKTNGIGKLASSSEKPLKGGVDVVTIKCTYPFSESNGMDFTLNIIQGSKVVKTQTFTSSSNSTETFTSDAFGVQGDFRIEVVNNCPSKVTKNKDRLGIYELSWTAPESNKEVEFAWEVEDVVLHIGEEFTELPKLIATVDGVESAEALAAVTYESDNEELIKFNADGTFTFNGNIDASAVITAKAPASVADFANVDDAVFTLHVSDPQKTNESFTFSALGFTSGDEIPGVSDNIVTLTFNQGPEDDPEEEYEQPAPRYMETAYGKAIRMYYGNNMTISVPEGFALVRVLSDYAVENNKVLVDHGTMNSDYTDWKAADEEHNSVTFTLDGTSGYRSWEKVVVYFKHIHTTIAGFEHNVHMYGNSAKLYYTIYINHHMDCETYEVDFKVDGVSHKTTEHQISVVEAPQGAMMRVSPANPTTHIASGSIEAADINTTGASKEHQIEVTIAHNNEVLSDHTYTTTETSDGTTGIEEVAADAAAAAEYFTLQGVRVAEPQAGNIYLVRRAGKVVKQLVK
ncbi:MAG: hypothetical protein K2G07_06445 [Muribaculaceae bacterium]|nr:hypothetical protein [Muribaculaceae bacterium]